MRVQVEVFSDVICPWCYIGKRRLEKALQNLSAEHPVRVRWLPFELNPQMGGPGFQDFRTFTFNSQFYEPVDPVGYEFNRRTVYRTWVRSGRRW